MKKKPSDNAPLDRDREGKALYEEDILAFLRDELARRREQRRPLEMQWTLNANFYAGHQNCAIFPQNGEIRDLDDAGASFNRIAPLLETRMAHLKQLRYKMTVRPATGDADDEQRAAVATRLLGYLTNASDFESKRNMMLSWCELCGTAFVLSWWDRDGGRVIARRENGTPIREGELRYTLLTPYEVYPENVNRQDVDDQPSILIEQVLGCDAVYELYGVVLPGEEVDCYELTPTGVGDRTALGFTCHRAPDSVRVLTYFERPTRDREKGRLIIAAGDRVLFYGDLPYDTIPLVAVKSKDVPGQFFGGSVITELIPLQRAYNGVKNKIHDYIRTLAANPLLVPEGSVADIESIGDCGVTAGTVLEYNPDRGAPTPLPLAALPSEVRFECEAIAAEMEYAAGVSQLMVIGATPNGVTSGTAINSLREIDNTRLSLTGDNLRDAVRRLGVMWLAIYRRCADGCRVLEIAGEDNVGGALVWSASDLNSFDVVFDAENELKYGEEQQKQAFFTALKMGLFNDENGQVPKSLRRRALELMRLGSYGELLTENELQAANARRENASAALGEVPAIGLYDDDALHLEEHRRHALSRRFAALRASDPDAAAAFDAHIAAHAERLARHAEIIRKEKLV